MKIEIKSRWNGTVLFEGEFGSLKFALQVAVGGGADLRGAYLGGADLGGAYLGGADLGGADLRGAYLGGAYLGGADLGGAYLRGAYLGGADLGGADLRGADLRGADLGGAYLRGADLRNADLGGADLRGADLRGADLRNADLRDADLRGAITEPASPEEIARLDAVREIVLAKPKRLDMTSWHSGNWSPDHTPEEEHGCGSAHCIAGWLQALSPDKEIREMDAEMAGRKLAPASSYMFFVPDEVALEWLKERKYAETSPAKS